MTNVSKRRLFNKEESKLVSYITLDMTITDPATMVTGDVNGAVIQWIRANSHRVVAKKTAEGQVTVCQLKDDDGTKYHDGSDATGLCDYYDQSANTARVVVRSHSNSYTNGGVAFAYANYVASSKNVYSGSRLAFRGEIVEEDNVSAFQSI